MRSHRSPTSYSGSSKYSSNFELVKQKTYSTNQNPQQFVHNNTNINLKPTTPLKLQNRYDWDPSLVSKQQAFIHNQRVNKANNGNQQKIVNYRVRKSPHSNFNHANNLNNTYTYTHTSKSQRNANPNNQFSNKQSCNDSDSKSYTGKTVYQIYNTKKQNYTHSHSNRNSKSNSYTETDPEISLISKSEILTSDNKNTWLQNQARLKLPTKQTTSQKQQSYQYQYQYHQYDQKLKNHSRSYQFGSYPKKQAQLVEHQSIIPEQQSNSSEPETQISPFTNQSPYPYAKVQRIYLNSNDRNIRTGLIYKQKAFKKPQMPLMPSLAQPQQQMRQPASLKKKIHLNIPKQDTQHENPESQILNTPKKVSNKDIKYQKDLVKHFDERARYARYRHSQKIKEKLKNRSLPFPTAQQNNTKVTNYQNAFPSKQQRIEKIDYVDICYGWTINDLTKVMHHPANNRVKISIKLPNYFQEVIEKCLPKQALKFKAEMCFQQLSSLSAHFDKLSLTTSPFELKQSSIQVVSHPESLAFLLTYAKYKQQTKGSFQTENMELDKLHTIDQPKNKETKKYAINWYNDGSVYAGQIKNDVRQGVGLQWVPGSYVYYGQYLQNFRHGYGVIKYNNMEVYLGLWSYDSYHGYGKIIGQDGWVKEEGVWRDGTIKTAGKFAELS